MHLATFFLLLDTSPGHFTPKTPSSITTMRITITVTPFLPPELCPFYERKLVKDPNQVGAKFVNDWLKEGGTNNRSLMVCDLKPPEDATRGSFQLSRSDVEKLKQSVVFKKKGSTNLHLSTFVLSLACAWVCRVRAEEITNKSVALALTVDCRGRLEPPLPSTYFGNCVGFRLPIAETRDLLGEEGLVVAVEAVSDALETLKDGAVSGAENWSSWLLYGVGAEADVKTIGVAGSPRFEVYGSDFGWGRPKKVEMVSIEKTAVFGLSDSRNGDGIEIGFVSKKKTMETFASLFVNGLQS
ncbi:Anthocyanin 5-aromatic acyltransferase [Glycine soja]|nr:Anthocyanin 5-aromatic acyltransferase [Glycine soja]